MAKPTQMQDTEWSFLEAMMTAATEEPSGRRQGVKSFYVEIVGNWDAEEFKRYSHISMATFACCVRNLHLVLRGAVQLQHRYQLRRE